MKTNVCTWSRCFYATLRCHSLVNCKYDLIIRWARTSIFRCGIFGEQLDDENLFRNVCLFRIIFVHLEIFGHMLTWGSNMVIYRTCNVSLYDIRNPSFRIVICSIKKLEKLNSTSPHVSTYFERRHFLRISGEWSTGEHVLQEPMLRFHSKPEPMISEPAVLGSVSVRRFSLQRTWPGAP